MMKLLTGIENKMERLTSIFLTLSQTSPGFLRVCSASLLKTLSVKEKLLVMSNFSFSHSVFYPFRELSAIFIKFKIVLCILFQFGGVKNLSFGKGSKECSSPFQFFTIDKILDWSKLKAFPDNKLNINEKLNFGLGEG